MRPQGRHPNSECYPDCTDSWSDAWSDDWVDDYDDSWSDARSDDWVDDYAERVSVTAQVVQPRPLSALKKAAVPATDKVVPPQEGLPFPADAAGEDVGPPYPPGDLPAEPEIIGNSKPKRTVEEAQSKEHQMTHLPKNPFCGVCSKAKIATQTEEEKSG